MDKIVFPQTAGDTVPFNLPDVIVTLNEEYPDICSENNEWLYYKGDTYGVTFNLATNQQIMLHIHILDEPEDAVLVAVKTLCKLFNCRAFDTTSGEFI